MTAINFPHGAHIYANLASPTNIRGLPRYASAELYVTQDIIDGWGTVDYSPTLFGCEPQSGSASAWPYVYGYDSNSDNALDEWTDGFSGAPSLQLAITEGWQTIEFYAATSGGTNRLAVNGEEVTWTSAYSINLAWVYFGNRGGAGITEYDNTIYGGLFRIGTTWDSGDLFEFDGRTATQGDLDGHAATTRFFLENGGGGLTGIPSIGAGPPEPTPEPSVPTFTRIKWGHGLTVTDEGGGVIRVDVTITDA